MDKYCEPIFWQNDIRISRQVATVNAVTESLRVEQLANSDFRLSVLAAYGGHHPASRFRIDCSHIKPAPAEQRLPIFLEPLSRLSELSLMTRKSQIDSEWSPHALLAFHSAFLPILEPHIR